MIQFQDTATPTELSEMTSCDGFKTIRSENNLTPDQTQNFWNQTFLRRDIHLEEISLSEIYGRSQDEFHFDFEITPDLQSYLDAICSEKWTKLDELQKENLIRGFSSALSEKLGIQNIPGITYFYDSPNSCGAYYPDFNNISINKALFSNPAEVVNTIAHETRHAYQHQHASIAETKQDVLYRLNFQNYISAVPIGNGKYLYFLDYQDQLVEAEARAFASIFRKGGQV